MKLKVFLRTKQKVSWRSDSAQKPELVVESEALLTDDTRFLSGLEQWLENEIRASCDG